MHKIATEIALLNGCASALIAFYLTQTQAPVDHPLGLVAAGTLLTSTVLMALSYALDSSRKYREMRGVD